MKIKEIKIINNTETCADINLILGANNTGKSTFIRELEEASKTCQIGLKNKWITGVKFEASGIKTRFDSLFPGVSAFAVYEGTEQEINSIGGANIFSSNWNNEVFQAMKAKLDTSETYEAITHPSKDRDWHYFSFVNNMSVSMENCDSRLSGPFFTQINRVDENYKDIVHYFYSQNSLFQKISDHIKDVFGIEIIFDDLEQGQKDIRLAPDVAKPASFPNRRNEGQFWAEHSPILASQGDGLKAYLKILYALFNPAKDVIIIDEPEAFLHSPQRRSLGKFIADNASSGKQIFISTHDSEFLRGVLTNTTCDTQVVHLKEKLGKRSYTVNRTPSNTRTRNNNELMLNSYFNKLTVLCEAEDDRVIYQYASQSFFPTPTVDIHFLGLNAKSDLFLIFKHLQSLEIETVGIVDIDVLYSGECLGLSLNQTEKNLIEEVKNLLNALSQADRDIFKENGVVSLSSNASLSQKVQDAIQIAKKYKIFIVPIGELESWLDTPTASKRKVQAMKNEIDTSPTTTKKSTLKKFIGEVIS
ncbi:MAG: ATP-binding protein [Candidatus Paceibacterota bacterium]